MLNNPIQQIERTQDAYAGNPEGLQKRANMSKRTYRSSGYAGVAIRSCRSKTQYGYAAAGQPPNR